uniref:Uncharacterized protein n=1 Tax=Aegilops tauschii subsp. strangulata TaxID=200361 RepID=A0A452YI51_AEGTS
TGKVRKRRDRMEVLEAEEATDELASLAIRWLEHGATLRSRWGGAAQVREEAGTGNWAREEARYVLSQWIHATK